MLNNESKLMKKINRFGMAIILISLLLLGCQQQENSLDVKEVNLFKSNEFKKENSELIVTSNETDNTEVFETVNSILSDTTKQVGVVDVVEPNYYLEIIYTDKSTK